MVAVTKDGHLRQVRTTGRNSGRRVWYDQFPRPKSRGPTPGLGRRGCLTDTLELVRATGETRNQRSRCCVPNLLVGGVSRGEPLLPTRRVRTSSQTVYFPRVSGTRAWQVPRLLVWPRDRERVLGSGEIPNPRSPRREMGRVSLGHGLQHYTSPPSSPSRIVNLSFK